MKDIQKKKFRISLGRILKKIEQTGSVNNGFNIHVNLQVNEYEESVMLDVVGHKISVSQITSRTGAKENLYYLLGLL